MGDVNSISASEKKLFENIIGKECCSKYYLLNKCNNPPGGMQNSVKLIKQCRDDIKNLLPYGEHC